MNPSGYRTETRCSPAESSNPSTTTDSERLSDRMSEGIGSKGQFRIKYPSIFLYKCELLYFKACIYYENY